MSAANQYFTQTIDDGQATNDNFITSQACCASEPINFIPDLQQTMTRPELILRYEGTITRQVTNNLLRMTERTLRSLQECPATGRRVFHIAMELLQNLGRYNRDLPDTGNHARPGVFLIGRTGNGYSLVAGNPVHKSSVLQLSQALERVNSLNAKQLKGLYIDIIRDTRLPEKGGAGLGFVTMARKSGEKLIFDFREMSEDYCFFRMKVNVYRTVRLYKHNDTADGSLTYRRYRRHTQHHS